MFWTKIALNEAVTSARVYETETELRSDSAVLVHKLIHVVTQNHHGMHARIAITREQLHDAQK